MMCFPGSWDLGSIGYWLAFDMLWDFSVPCYHKRLARIPMASLDTGWTHLSLGHSSHFGNCRAARHGDHKLIKLCQTWVSVLQTLVAFPAHCSIKIDYIFTQIKTNMGEYALKRSCNSCDVWNIVSAIVVSFICGHYFFQLCLYIYIYIHIYHLNELDPVGCIRGLYCRWIMESWNM